MTDYKSKALRNTALVLFISLFGAFLAYIFRIVLARELGVRFYGFFFSAYALINLLIILRDFGLRNALVKYLSEFKAKNDYPAMKGLILFVTYFHLALSLVFLAVLWHFSGIIASQYFNAPEMATAFRIFLVVFAISFIEQIFMFIFQGMQRMLLFSLVDPLRLAITLVMMLIFLEMDFGVLAPVYSLLISYSSVAVFHLVVFLWKVFPSFTRIKAKISKELAGKYLKFGIFTSLTYAGTLIITQLDTLLLTYFRSLEEVGVYQVAVPISTLLLYLAYAITKVMVPLSSEMHSRNERNHLQAGIKLLQKYLAIVIVPLAMLMIAFPEIIIRIFFGNQYLAAAASLRILSVGAVFYSIAVVNEGILTGIGKPQINTKNITIAVIINVAISFFAIPRYGITGAASAAAISYSALLLVSTYRLNRFMEIHSPYRSWLKVLVSGAVFVVAIALAKQALKVSWPIELLVCTGIGLVLYVSILVILREIKVHEVQDLLFAKKR